jgi:outer membrane receptor protein involved in Fe transport
MRQCHSLRGPARAARVAVVLVAALASLLLLTPVFAQEQGGAVEGTVRDQSGAGVPGATVEAREARGIVLSATTDAAGLYRFPSLPAGTWEILVQLQGFAPVRRPDVRLALGQLLRVDVALSLSGVQETVTVTEASPVIDVKQSASFATIRDEQIDKLPRGRDFLSLASQAPGANVQNVSAGLSIDGGSGADNRFIIDGIDTTDLQMGVSGKRLITDVIDEVQVKSSGYAAEYGGAIGGVVNVVTKTGTNAFHGSVGAYFSDDALDAGRRPTVRIDPADDTRAETVTYPEDDYSTWEPGFTLGGPIIRDRLWFFGSYIPSYQATDRTVTYLSNGETQTVRRTDRSQFATGTLSAQLGSRWYARAGVNWAPYENDGDLPALDGSSDPATPFGDFDQERPNLSASGSVSYTPGPRAHFNLRGGYFRTDNVEVGNPDEIRFQFMRTNAGVPGVPPDLVRPRNFQTVPTNVATLRDVQDRLGFQADGTWYVRAAGQHTLKAGVQFNRIGNDVYNGYQKQRVLFYWGDAYAATDGTLYPSPYGYARAYYIATTGDIRSDNWGLFAQDSWTIGSRFTLNLGLRTEHERVPSFSAREDIPTTAIDFGFGEKLAPRVGFSWDVKGDGRFKAYGSWGMFYDIMKLELPRGSFGGDRWLDYRYLITSPVWTEVASNPECPPTCSNATFVEVVDQRAPSNDPNEYRIDPDLRPMRSQELVFGLQHDLGHEASVGLRYVHKQVDRAIEDQGKLVGTSTVYYITNPGFGLGQQLVPGLPDQPEAVRDYDAVELDFRKRTSDRWSFWGRYWWSRLHGNYSGLASSDEVAQYNDDFGPGQTRRARTSPNVNRDFDDLAMSFAENGVPSYGPLPADRPHQVRLQALYDFPFGTSVGATFYAASGTPVSRTASLPPGVEPVYYSGRGSDGRTSTLWQADLYLQHEFKLNDRLRLQLSANVLNLFDTDTVTLKWNYVTQEEVPITTEEYLNGADIGRAIADNRVLLDPRFLQPRDYQLPRSVRLAARLTF